MIHVREAAPGDAAALAELRWEFRAGRDPAVESHEAFVNRCAAWMRRELTAGGPWRAWVAVRDGGDDLDNLDNPIVGQVWVNLLQKLPNPIGERERHAYLSNLYVQPGERGGVGTQLLLTALGWARANGVDRVVLWPSAKSVTLYLRQGFTRDGDVMELTC
jgi:GNAT superfamily N-acetyltransferase